MECVKRRRRRRHPSRSMAIRPRITGIDRYKRCADSSSTAFDASPLCFPYPPLAPCILNSSSSDYNAVIHIGGCTCVVWLFTIGTFFSQRVWQEYAEGESESLCGNEAKIATSEFRNYRLNLLASLAWVAAQYTGKEETMGVFLI